MDLTLTDSERAFREELRTWLQEHAPRNEPEGRYEEHYAWRREWLRTLHHGGYSAVHWPAEYGGQGATLVESAIFNEEIARAGLPLPANTIALIMIGPTIIAWGTEEQKQRHLPAILSGDEIWCQGFSEPDAGSDFAAVKMRAERDGDDWVVTGQKVWTSGAQWSRWCLLVARTDTSVAKHKGLTVFLLDMESPGVEVRPLRQITGEAEFNEMFLEGVRVPQENVLGGVGNGWKVSLTTLMNERAGLAFGLQVRLRQQLDKLTQAAEEAGRLEDPRVLDALGDLHLRCEVIRLTALRGLTATMKHGQPGPEGSLTKWMWSETNQMAAQLAVDLLGADTLRTDSPWGYELLRSRANSIEGGTTEVLKNIIAERVLGLPKAR